MGLLVCVHTTAMFKILSINNGNLDIPDVKRLLLPKEGSKLFSNSESKENLFIAMGLLSPEFDNIGDGEVAIEDADSLVSLLSSQSVLGNNVAAILVGVI